jgi:electron transfer flavoprotein alpha subunit
MNTRIPVLPTGLPRIDPRRHAIITPSGLRRIVLGSTAGERLSGGFNHAPSSAKPVRSPGPFNRCTLVVAHSERGTLDDHVRQVVAAAALLSAADNEVVLAVLGPCHEEPADLGVDRLLVWSDADRSRFAPGLALTWLHQLQAQLQPRQWLLADQDADADLGRRLAVHLKLPMLAGVVELQADQVRRRVGPRQDALSPPAALMLLALGVASTLLPFVGLGVRQEHAPPHSPEAEGVEDMGIRTGDPQSLALEEVDFIMAAGNGVQDVALFNSLAQELGAATGASRVAVDDGRFPRHKQIGATGKTVSASGYLALGISGAVQHLQGIKDCRHVIAVTLDASAPIAKRADLVVVEDSGSLMQALLELVREEKERART